ncbi:hypothetical protein C1N32_06440 [Vibrio diazotrophicus]|uniref:PEGA domain-containing protein n=1 Tax=Vibrio diazotrophicus TaxID=685 RepID=A0A2J8I5C4_VIBDI|nr:hypothetical protein [Vibrio diazotrophicus]PNI05732.1 hypothetical protein C1N32_06440 [Vibrio diazotrophicus]
MIRFISTFALLMTALPVKAQSKLYEILKEGFYGEVGSQIASLPGLKQLQELEEAKKYKLVTNKPHKGRLNYKPEQEHKNAWISLYGTQRSIRLFGDASIPVGQHTVFVTPSDTNLMYYKGKVVIKEGHSQELTVPKFYARNMLFEFNITTTPKNATIRVMNIKPKYRYGMKLPFKEEGYDIEISKRGYKTIRDVVNLNSEGQHFHYTMRR